MYFMQVLKLEIIKRSKGLLQNVTKNFVKLRIPLYKLCLEIKHIFYQNKFIVFIEHITCLTVYTNIYTTSSFQWMYYVLVCI